MAMFGTSPSTVTLLIVFLYILSLSIYYVISTRPCLAG